MRDNRFLNPEHKGYYGDMEGPHASSNLTSFGGKLDDDGDNIIVVCPGGSFTCSKTALCRSSDYFCAMFSSGMREASCKEIYLDLYHSTIMEVIFQYVQTGDCRKIKSENVHQVLQASVYFQIRSLQIVCEEKILHSVNIHNALMFWKQYPSCDKIRERSEVIILQNFTSIASLNPDEFYNLTGRELLYFLSQDNLIIEDTHAEEELCTQVTKWFEKGKVGITEHYISDIFNCIKLPLLDRKFLNQLKKSFYFSTNRHFKRLLKEAFRYQDNPGLQLMNDSFCVQPRASYSTRKVLIVFGLFSKFYSSGINRLICYSFTDEKWKELSPPPNGLSQCHGESVLLVSGGKHTRTVMKYNGLSNTWSQCTSMKDSRMDHVMIPVRHNVYCFGGKILSPTSDGFEEMTISSVVKYNSEEDGTWKTCGDLTVGVANASSAVLNDRVYIFGGHVPDLEDPVTTVQCFDVETNTCCVLCHTPFIFDSLYASYSVHSIHILASGKLYSFSTENMIKETEIFQEVGHNQRLYFESPMSMWYCNNYLYVLGEKDDTSAGICKTTNCVYQIKDSAKPQYRLLTELPHIPKSVICRTLIVDMKTSTN